MADTTAVSLNYNLTHLKGLHTPRPKTTLVPDIYFDTTGLIFNPGASVAIPVKLGTASWPMNNVLGLGCEIKVNGMIPASLLTVSHQVSWLAQGSNKMVFQKAVSNIQTDIAYARLDHSQTSGAGTIAFLHLNIPANAAAGDTALLYFDNVVMVDSAANVLSNYNVLPARIVITDPLNISHISNVRYAVLQPNPSEETTLALSLTKGDKLHICVADLTGKMLWQSRLSAPAGEQFVRLPNHFAAGIYQVILRSEEEGSTQFLKWVKE
jgi:hypothetical protein